MSYIKLTGRGCSKQLCTLLGRSSVKKNSYIHLQQVSFIAILSLLWGCAKIGIKLVHTRRLRESCPFAQNRKKWQFFWTDFSVEIFLHRAPRGLGSISHILCYFFSFCRCLTHLEYLHKCHIFTQVSQYLHKSVTCLDIFTQSVTST